MPPTDTAARVAAFSSLRSLLQSFAVEMEIVADQQDTYYLEIKGVHEEGASRLFAAVQLYSDCVRIYANTTNMETIFHLYGFKKIQRLYVGDGVLRFTAIKPELVPDLASFFKLLKKRKDQQEAGLVG